MTTTQHRIDSAALSAAAAIARLALIEAADIDMGNRIRRARVALIRANQRRDLFAAACAVEALQSAVAHHAE